MIGIIAAMEDEMSILLDKLNLSVYEQVCGCRFYLGKVNDTEVVLTTCGVGKVNAAIAASVMVEFYECKWCHNHNIYLTEHIMHKLINNTLSEEDFNDKHGSWI